MARVLTFNCHEAYVHLLGKLGHELDIIDGLPGRQVSRWDERARPVPARARLIRLDEALGSPRYDVAIAHNLTDLLALRTTPLPKILVFHVNLEARVREEPGPHDIETMRRQVSEYLAGIGAVAVAVSEAKARSWGQRCAVIRPCADPEEYRGFDGSLPVALRVANQVLQRQERFAWNAHRAITQGHAAKLVGHNPGLEGVQPAGSWQELRTAYREHRAYVHTAGAGLDDGYNLGLIEAMVTGMPVVSLAGAESPVVDGVSGYVSDDVAYLNQRLGALLADRELALELGGRARNAAVERFSVSGFVHAWQAAIELATSTFAATSS
jgi:Glycosyl transferases group 1